MRERGFTLTECLMASAILAFAVAAIAQAIVSGQAHVEQALHDQRAVTLGEALLEEIVSYPYNDPDGGGAIGPDSSEYGRDTFDNADDFDGYSDSAGSLTDAQGEDYPATYQVFSRSVAVAADSVTLSGFTDSADGIRVTVTVTDESGRQWTLIRFLAEPAE